jgi:hypothetical protein
MAKKPSELKWTMREVLPPGTPTFAVACPSGFVFTGGDGVFRVPPKSWEVQHRPLPSDVGPVHAVAMEPRPPFRVAMAPDTGDVLIFTDTADGTTLMGLGFAAERGSKRAMELAWVAHEGESHLFARTEDGGFYRSEIEGWGQCDLPPVRAIAQDHEGGVAALMIVENRPTIYVSHDAGENWRWRRLDLLIEAAPDAPACLALAGDALAFAVGDSGPYVIWGPKAKPVRVPGLTRTCALAFTGAKRGSWIYAAQQRAGDEPANISLIPGKDPVMVVFTLLCEDDEPLDLGPIAWDPARKALMVGSRSGLLAMYPDRPKRVKAKAKPLMQ